MPFEIKYTNEMKDNVEVYGVTEISCFSGMLTFYASSGASMESMHELNLKIKGISASCWNLFTMAVVAGRGDAESNKMFIQLKKQLIREINLLIEVASTVNLEESKKGSNKNENES